MIELIYDLIYIVPLSLTAMLWWCGLFAVEEVSFAMYALTLVPLIIMDMFVHLKARGRLLLSGITLAGALSVTFVIYKFFEDFSLKDYPWFVPFLVISVISFLLGSLMARSRIARVSVSVLLIVLLVLSLEVIEYPAGNGVFFAFFVILISIVNEIHLLWKRSGDTDQVRHVVFTSPFVLAIVFTASLFHFPDRPYDWKLFITIWNGVTVAVDRIKFNFGPGSDTYIGFSDSGEIGSGIDSGGHVKPAFEINAQADVFVPVYLTGNMYDTFDGRSWTNEKPAVENARRFDSLESIISARLGADDHRDIIRDATINVRYLNVKSKYLFAPAKLSDYTFISGGAGVTEDSGVLSFDKHNPYRLEVRENFFKVNSDSPVFYDFMAGESKVSEDAWKSTVRTFGLTGFSDVYGYDKYMEYRASTIVKYSEDVKLSAELKEKLDILYDGAGSEYEKLKRLEASLGMMAYSTETGPLPDDVTDAGTFLDYFLLNKKEGYCTHYATAFVLLARAEGLPARYVQGYRTVIDRAGTYTVTSDMAHAWPEVYFEGKGWVTFEPTPGYYKETSWLTVSNKIIKIDPVKPQDVFEDDAAPGEDAEETGSPDVEERVRLNIYVIIIPLAAIVFVLIVFMAVGRAITRHRYNRMPLLKKIRVVSKDIFATLAMMGYKPSGGETLKEFAGRIEPEVGKEVNGFVDTYELVLYSDTCIKDIKLSPVIGFHDHVLKLLKQRSKVKYILKTLMSQF